MSDIDPLAGTLLHLAGAGDPVGGISEVRRALGDGTSPDTVSRALARAQREVGERWYRGEWTVADEHAATAVVDAALAALEAETAADRLDRATVVVVACPEGEWHAMPARLLAADLRRLGAVVRFLGASMPPDHLAAHAAASAADVVALSASTALVFAGVARAVDAVHDVGLPVVVGGPAFGGSSGRAASLGADATADDARSLLQLDLTARRRSEVVDGRREREVDVLRMAMDRPAVVAGAAARLERGVTEGGGWSTDRSWEELDHLVRTAEAAHLADDPTIMDDAVAWFDPLLGYRGRPAGTLAAMLEALRAAATTAELRRAVDRAFRQLTFRATPPGSP